MRYVEKPELSARVVADLRIKVGWEAREEQLETVLGRTYLSIACFDENNLVGFVDVISDGVEDALIRNLIVDPGYHQKGIGHKLLGIVVRRLKADQIKTVNVLFEPGLNEFYRKAGFKIVSGGIIDTEEGF